MFNVDNKETFKECCSGVFNMENILKFVTECNFRKYLGPYINSSERICNGVCMSSVLNYQAFSVNDSERVNDGVCF